MTILEIKERLSQFKLDTSGKESYTVTEESTNDSWPFPRSRPDDKS